MHGRPGVVVAGYDTELFGHWWFEGPDWLAAVLRELPAAGVRVSTLRGAVQAGAVGTPVELPASSWGSGKDWRVWDGPAVDDLVAVGTEVQRHLLDTVAKRRAGLGRDPALDMLAQQGLLALSSDWAFMISKGSAPGYARQRAMLHAGRVRELADLLAAGRTAAAARLVGGWGSQDDVFGHLDARRLG